MATLGLEGLGLEGLEAWLLYLLPHSYPLMVAEI